MTGDQTRERAIYDQNCQWYRYQDTLMWGRFQTVAAIEGAMLYGLYQIKLPNMEKRALVIVGSILVGILCRVAIIDGNFASGHLQKIKEYEGYSLQRLKGPTGGQLMVMAIGLLTILNILLVVRTFTM